VKNPKPLHPSADHLDLQIEASGSISRASNFKLQFINNKKSNLLPKVCPTPPTTQYFPTTKCSNCWKNLSILQPEPKSWTGLPGISPMITKSRCPFARLVKLVNLASNPMYVELDCCHPSPVRRSDHPHRRAHCRLCSSCQCKNLVPHKVPSPARPP